MPDASLSLPPRAYTRGVVALFIAALLVTSLSSADPAAGAGLSGQISSNRRSQLYSESIMRQADRSVAHYKRQGKVTRKRLKQAKRSVKHARRQFAQAKQIVRVRSQRLKAAEAKFAHVGEDADLKAWHKRLRGLRRDLRISHANRRRQGKDLRRSIRIRSARKRSLRASKRARRAAVWRRESAEAGLASRIVQMTRLAQQRAAKQSDVSLTSDGSAFAWPSGGRITQPFGCTGVRWNPRRGSCRHFHDGIDVVSGYGSAVRAAAVGVVAFVGWNPWDARGRAFIVVIGHPNGFVTRYGHLTPTRRVRVGQVVRKGQIIGRMGNTGFSTGTHLHMELLRGTTPLNPLTYLPSGVVKVKKSKKASEKGKRKQGKAARRHRKGSAARSRRAAAQQKDRDEAASQEPIPSLLLPGAVGASALGLACDVSSLEAEVPGSDDPDTPDVDVAIAPVPWPVDARSLCPAPVAPEPTDPTSPSAMSPLAARADGPGVPGARRGASPGAE